MKPRDRHSPRLLPYTGRALLLRCPECGLSPIFPSLSQTRSLCAWRTPLPGCPRCDYPYEREPGYFLAAIWIVHQFTVIGSGLAFGLALLPFIDDLRLVLLATAIPTLLLAVLFIRHAKSLYLAFDHYLDPHVKQGNEASPTDTWRTTTADPRVSRPA